MSYTSLATVEELEALSSGLSRSGRKSIRNLGTQDDDDDDDDDDGDDDDDDDEEASWNWKEGVTGE